MRTTRIAHLSDIHMLGARPNGLDPALRFLSFGRALDGGLRRRKLARALAAAKASGATALVLAGDLTECGAEAEYEALADVLLESAWDPDDVILVPGNHDTYAGPGAFRHAIGGPLSDFRRGAADAHGKVVERHGLTFMPVDVACHQSIARSSGWLTRETAKALEMRLSDPAFRERNVVLTLHHPPFPRNNPAWQWVDGLRGWQRLEGLLDRYRNVQVLHGHMHHASDRATIDGAMRVFGAPAVVDDGTNPRVRVYDVVRDELRSQGYTRLGAVRSWLGLIAA